MKCKNLLILSLSTLLFLNASLSCANAMEYSKKTNNFNHRELTTNVKSSGIYLINGVPYDKFGNPLDSNNGIQMKGKLSWAAKALKKAWNKIPLKYKKMMGGYAGFAKVLDYIDHFTGAVEDACYRGCKSIGLPDWAAWAVTKILLLSL